MKADVYAAAENSRPRKILSKETLNNRELIMLASGLDPLDNTPEAYREAYRFLGIDFINRVPEENCPVPLEPGTSVKLDDTYMLAALGLYDTCCRYRYPYETVDEFLDQNRDEPLDYYALRTPVPHLLELKDIRKREVLIDDIGCYYHQLYTTLFMWGIEHLGWEVFMMAVALDPGYVDRHFLEPAFDQTCKLTEILLESESPYIFFHDDLATAGGLACRKEWMEEYLFPRYEKLWAKVHRSGKKVIFVSDGNMTPILKEIADTGVDGVMFESPATPFEAILEAFPDRLIIGGIDTSLLGHGTPEKVTAHVHDVMKKASRHDFAISSCGGIHGEIPIENLEAYFDARSDYGINPVRWRFSDHP
jgi:hypothetical protein